MKSFNDKVEIQDLDLHLYETDRRNLATLQKYLIVNNILTIDDLAVLTDGFMTNGHSDKVREIAYNCLTLAQDEEGIISNVLEGDDPNSKIYYESSFSPSDKEDRDDSIKVQMKRGRTREEAEVAYDEWKATELDNKGSAPISLKEMVAQKKEASK
jgi:hypothetical protein